MRKSYANCSHAVNHSAESTLDARKALEYTLKLIYPSYTFHLEFLPNEDNPFFCKIEYRDPAKLDNIYIHQSSLILIIKEITARLANHCPIHESPITMFRSDFVDIVESLENAKGIIIDYIK